MPPKKSQRKSTKRKQERPPDDGERQADKKAKMSTNKSAVDWLLSDEALCLSSPHVPAGKGETDSSAQDTKPPPPDDAGKLASKEDAADVLDYPASKLTPFQDLVASVIFSKPLSHRLGLRTIRTLLNPPFGLRSAKDLDESGYEGRRKVMWEARTQHKEKTALQLGDLVAGVRDLADGKDEGPDVDGLEGLRRKAKATRKSDSPKDSADAIRELLVSHIKGLGPTGVGIFLRRVQVDFDEIFPYCDDRALADAVRFGLIEEGDGPEALAAVVGGSRDNFVRLLDVLVGLDLEKKLDEAIEKANA